MKKVILTIFAIGALAAVNAEYKLDSPSLNKYELMLNPGMEQLSLDPKRKGCAESWFAGSRTGKGSALVDDAKSAFSGARYIQVDTSKLAGKQKSVIMRFRLAENNLDKLPKDLICVIRAKGRGTVKLAFMLRAKKKEDCVRFYSESFKVTSDKWRQFEYRFKLPEKIDRKKIKGLSPMIIVTGKVALDAGHLMSAEALNVTVKELIPKGGISPFISCPRANKDPKIDGVMSPGEWTRAVAVTGFTTTNYEFSPRQTIVWMTYDEKSLYIAFRSEMMNVHGKNYGENKQDCQFRHNLDFFEIHLIPDNRNRFQLMINPAGGIIDYNHTLKGKAAKDWNGKYTYRTTNVDSGDTSGGVQTFARRFWTGEIAIPYTTLGVKSPQTGMAWQVNFCRDFSVLKGARKSKDWTTWTTTSSFKQGSTTKMIFGGDCPAVQIMDIGSLSGGNVSIRGKVSALKQTKIDFQGAAVLKGIGSRVLDTCTQVAADSGGASFSMLDQIDTDKPLTGNFIFAAQADNSKQLLMLQSTPFSCSSAFKFRAYLNYGKKRLNCTLDLSAKKTLPSGSKAYFEIVGTGIKMAMPVAPTFNEKWLDIANLKPGKYTVICKMVDAAGKVVSSGRDEFTMFERPAWMDKIMKPTGLVPRPFTPVKVAGKSVSVVLRKYLLQDNGLPAAVYSLDRNIFSKPAQLRAVVDGKPVALQFTELELLKSGPAQAVWQLAGTGAGLKLTGTLTIDFDGFAMWDVTLSATKSVRIDALSIDFFVNKQDAMYMRAENGKTEERYGTALYKSKQTKPVSIAFFWYNEGYWPHTGLFMHWFWLGGDKRGFTVMTDTDRYMTGPKRIEIFKQSAYNHLRWNLISDSVKLRGPRHWRFGYNATPFKPKPVKSRNYHSMMAARQANDYPEFMRDVFVRMGHYTKPNVYYKATRQTPGALKMNHQWGVKLVPYFSFGIGAEGTKEFDRHAQEFKLLPSHGGNAGTRGGWRTTCAASSLWRDYVTFKVKELTDKHKLDGLYLDVSRSVGCRNPAHGCGWWNNEKKLREREVNVFEMRELYKRIYTHFKTGGRDKVIFCHGADMGALPYIDVFTQGESWCKERNTGYKRLSPDFYRTIVARIQYGMPFTFYAYHQYSWRGGRNPASRATAADVMMMGMQFPNHFNVSDEDGVVPSMKLWKFTDPFFATAKFYPYWDNTNPAKTDKTQLFAATYKYRDKNKAVIFVSNWNYSPVNGTVSIDFKKLGFKPKSMQLVDVLAEKNISLPISNKVSVSIPKRDFRAIVLE